MMNSLGCLIMPAPGNVKSLSEHFKNQVSLLVGILILLFGIELFDAFLPGDHPLDRWGVQPRTLGGLPGIFFSPLLHDGFAHLGENSLSFVVLGWLVLLGGVQRFMNVTAIVVLVSGVGTWLIGSPGSNHIGLSGVIFGYLGFILGRGWYERKLGSVILAVLVGFFHIGMIFQLISVKAHVSWSMHFFGFVGGIITAWMMFHNRSKERPLVE
jgi:membrane associated rhomboid family serine protease